MWAVLGPPLGLSAALHPSASLVWAAPLFASKYSSPTSFSDFPFSTFPYLLMFPWILSSVLLPHYECCLSFNSTVLTTYRCWWYSAISPKLQTQTCIWLLSIYWINKPQDVFQICLYSFVLSPGEWHSFYPVLQARNKKSLAFSLPLNYISLLRPPIVSLNLLR